jgi:hypothetical protein
MKITLQQKIKRQAGSVLALWLIVAAIIVAIGVGLVIASQKTDATEISMFGAKIVTTNVFIAALFIIVVGVVTGIVAFLKRTPKPSISVNESENVEVYVLSDGSTITKKRSGKK